MICTWVNDIEQRACIFMLCLFARNGQKTEHMKDKIVFFDFDGVIVLTMMITVDLIRQVSPETTNEEVIDGFKGNIHRYFESKGISTEPNGEFFSKYTKLLEREAPIPGIADVIKRLSKQYELVIISSSSSSSIQSFLRKNGLASYFTEVLGYEVERSKSKKLTRILEERGLVGTDAVFVTDTLGDIKESHVAGIPAIGVTWGFHDADMLASGSPQAIVTSVRELETQIYTAVA